MSTTQRKKKTSKKQHKFLKKRDRNDIPMGFQVPTVLKRETRMNEHVSLFMSSAFTVLVLM